MPRKTRKTPTSKFMIGDVVWMRYRNNKVEGEITKIIAPESVYGKYTYEFSALPDMAFPVYVFRLVQKLQPIYDIGDTVRIKSGEKRGTYVKVNKILEQDGGFVYDVGMGACYKERSLTRLVKRKLKEPELQSKRIPAFKTVEVKPDPEPATPPPRRVSAFQIGAKIEIDGPRGGLRLYPIEAITETAKGFFYRLKRQVDLIPEHELTPIGKNKSLARYPLFQVGDTVRVRGTDIEATIKSANSNRSTVYYDIGERRLCPEYQLSLVRSAKLPDAAPVATRATRLKLCHGVISDPNSPYAEGGDLPLVSVGYSEGCID